MTTIPDIGPYLAGTTAIGAALTLLMGIVKKAVASKQLRFIISLAFSAVAGIGWTYYWLYAAGIDVTFAVLMANSTAVWGASLGVWNVWKPTIGAKLKG